MKKIYFVTILSLVFLTFRSIAQSVHYFEFTTQCGHGNWQDTSFIAATADQDVIDSVLTDMAKPYDERRFISGFIDYGDGGFNHNAGHWFLWHFIPGQWELADAAIEVCDGCPYSDVDADTAYWIGVLGIFCPWSGKPAREVSGPADIGLAIPGDRIRIFPNPARDYIIIQSNTSSLLNVIVYDATGREIVKYSDFTCGELSLPGLKSGLYLLHCRDSRFIEVMPLLIEN